MLISFLKRRRTAIVAGILRPASCFLKIVFAPIIGLLVVSLSASMAGPEARDLDLSGASLGTRRRRSERRAAKAALSVLDNTGPPTKRRYSDMLGELFSAAIHSDADFVVILGRRCYALFVLFDLAGQFDDAPPMLGRVMSQRSAERMPQAFEGCTVTLVDDTVRTGLTLAKYLSRLSSRSAAQINVKVLTSHEMPLDLKIDELPKKFPEWPIVASVPIDAQESAPHDGIHAGAFKDAVAAAVMAAPITYFCDFPIYEAGPSTSLAQDIELLAAVLVESGWVGRALPAGADDDVARFVLVDPRSGLRLRLTILLGEDGSVLSALVMPKLAIGCVTHVADSADAACIAAAEVQLRSQLFDRSLEAFGDFCQQWKSLVAPLDLRPQNQAIRGHWPRAEWTRVGFLMKSVLGSHISTPDASWPEVTSAGALMTLELQAADSTESVYDCVASANDGPGVTLAEICEQTGLEMLEVQFSLDVLHDFSRCVPRVRERRSEMCRVWTLGELPGDTPPPGNVVAEEILSTRGKSQKLHVWESQPPRGWVEVAPAFQSDAKNGRMLASLIDGRWWGPREQFVDDGLVHGIREVMASIPARSRYNGKSAPWFAKQSRWLDNLTPMAALRAGKSDVVKRLVDSDPNL